MYLKVEIDRQAEGSVLSSIYTGKNTYFIYLNIISPCFMKYVFFKLLSE